MSRLCRLKTASHGDDGKWAYDEIVSLRKQRDDLLSVLEKSVREFEYARNHLDGEPHCSATMAIMHMDDAIASVKGEQ